MIKKGSIIEYKGETLHTISIVDKVCGDLVYCKESVCSRKGAPFTHTRELYPEFTAEELHTVGLVGVEVFDVVYDSKLIPKEKFKNV